MNPPRRTRTLPIAFVVVAAIFTVAVILGAASEARGTQIAPGPDSPLGTTPPGSAPGTIPEAPEARETEAHLTTPVAVKVTPTYTG